MIPYTSFTYIYPPRPEKAIPPSLFGFYEKKKYLPQVKKNGTCSVIFVDPFKNVTAMGRHNNQHKQWAFTDESRELFTKMPPGWHVLAAELLHSKTPHIKDTNYIFDIMVFNGEYLIGNTYAQRYDLLLSLFLRGDYKSAKSHWVLNEKTWLARNLRGSFADLFGGLDASEDEGLVFKDPMGQLSFTNNSSWQVKCRKPHKNYGF